MKKILSKKTLSFLFKLALTLGAFGYVLGGVDMQHVQDVWQGQDHWLVLGAAGFILVQLVLGAVRWRLILYKIATPEDNLHISHWKAFEIYAISAFFSIWVPGGAMGTDVVRVWLTKANHIALALSINSVVIDRMAALVMLVFIVLVGLPQLGDIVGFNAFPILLFSLVAMALGLYVGRYAEHFASARFAHIKPVRWILHLTTAMRRLIKGTYKALVIFLYAACGHLLFCSAVYVLAQSLNIQLSLMQTFVLLPPIILAITLPISIGGWGVREMGIAGMLSLVGVPKAAAVLLSIQMGLIGAIVYLPAGFLWLAARNKHQKDAL